MINQNRYPGIRPFSREDKRLFFGRTESIARIARLLKLEKLIVLFGKSGLGKTSLVQAGAIPLLIEEDLEDGVEDYRIETIRFGSFSDRSDKGLTSEKPVERLRRAIQGKKNDDGFDLSAYVEDDHSPWFAAKARQMAGDHRILILIIDQSEELFTWPDPDVNAFKDALVPLVNQFIPDNLKKAVYQAAREEGIDRHKLLEAPAVKTMLVIRSDKLSGLDQLADALPDIYNKRFELPPLNMAAAREAIIEPARLAGEFSTPAFTYSQACLDHILAFLANKSLEEAQAAGHVVNKHTENIEGFQLQLICQHAEYVVAEKVQAGESNIELLPEDLGDLGEVTKSYYTRVLEGIEDPVERNQVQIFVEDGLIFESGQDSRRLTLFEGVIRDQFGISDERLEYLGNSRLIRRVALPEGGFSYELSHDSLIQPILDVRKQRVREVEKIKAEEQRQAELLAYKEEQERESKERQRKRYYQYLVVVSVLGLIALAGLGLSIWQNGKATKARKEAEAARFEAVAARDSTRDALAESQEIADQLKKLNLELAASTDRSDSLRILAEIQSRLAQAQKLQAQLARSRSEQLSHQLFSSAMSIDYPWMDKLQDFDKEEFLNQKFPDWVKSDDEEGDLIQPDSLSAEILTTLNRAVGLQIEEPAIALHMARRALLLKQDPLTEAVARKILESFRFQAEPVKSITLPARASAMITRRDPVQRKTNIVVGFADGSLRVYNDRLEQLGEPYHDHQGEITSIDVTSDNRYMVTGSKDRTIKIFSFGSGILDTSFLYGDDWVRQTRFSARNDALYVVGDIRQLQRYDQVRNRDNEREFRLEGRFNGHEDYIMAMDVNATDDSLVTGGAGGELKLWVRDQARRNLRIEKEIVLTDATGNGREVTRVRIVKNEVYVISSDGAIEVLRLRDLTPTTNGFGTLQSSAYNPQFVLSDDQTRAFFLQDNKTLGVWDSRTEVYGTAWQGNEDISLIAPLSRTDDILVIDQLGRLRRLRVTMDKDQISLDELVAGVNLPSMSTEDSILYGFYELDQVERLPREKQFHLVKSFNEILKTGSADRRQLEVIEEMRNRLLISSLASNRRGRPNKSDWSIRRQTMRIMVDLLGQQSIDTVRQFDHTDLYRASLVDGLPTAVSRWMYWAWKWDQTYSPTEKLMCARQAYLALPDSAWSQIVASTLASTLRAAHREEFANDVNGVCLSQDDQHQVLVTTDVGQYSRGAVLMDVREDGRFSPVWELSGQRDGDYIWSSAFTKDGNAVVTVSAFGKVSLWNRRTGRPIGFSEEIDEPIREIVFLEDDYFLLAVQTGMVLGMHVDSIGTGRRDTMLEGSLGYKDLVVFPETGVWVAAGNDGQLASGTRSGFSGHSFALATGAEANPEGFWIAGIPGSRTIIAAYGERVHKLQVNAAGEFVGNIQEPVVFNLHGNEYTSLAITPNGKKAVLGTSDGQLQVLDLDKMNLLGVGTGGEELFYDLEIPSWNPEMVYAGNADNSMYVYHIQTIEKGMQSWLQIPVYVNERDRQIYLDYQMKDLPEDLRQQFWTDLSSNYR